MCTFADDVMLYITGPGVLCGPSATLLNKKDPLVKLLLTPDLEHHSKVTSG